MVGDGDPKDIIIKKPRPETEFIKKEEFQVK